MLRASWDLEVFGLEVCVLLCVHPFAQGPPSFHAGDHGCNRERCHTQDGPSRQAYNRFSSSFGINKGC